MANGAATAPVDVGSPTPSGWGVEFSVLPHATSGTEPAQRHSAEETYVLEYFTCGDASEGSTLDVLGTRKAADPEFPEVVDVTEHLCRPVVRLLDEIEDSLREDREEALLDGEAGASESAVVACRRITIQIADTLAVPPSGFKWAVFGEDEGGVSLVLWSSVTGRRVDFRISADGLRISAVYIDENLKAKSIDLALYDRSVVRESAAWVDRQS